MSLYKKSLSIAVSAGTSPEDSLACGFQTTSLARIATSDTLKVTLGLSRQESFWRLLHSRSGSDLGALSTASRTGDRRHSRVTSFFQSAASLPTRDIYPTTAPTSPQAVSSPSKPVPSDQDYHRMLDKLHKVIHGSVFSTRSTVLTEEKPVDFSLEAEEWQYFRVKTQEKPVPMKLTLKRNRGKVLVYMSKSVQEPKAGAYDEVYTRDVVVVEEARAKFKLPWVFLGIRCVEDAYISISLEFGTRQRRHRQTHSHSALAALEELRKDEAKREELYKHVDFLLALRHESNEARFRCRNFIRENKAGVGRASDDDFQARRELEQNRRLVAIQKHLVHLKAKKHRAQQYMQRKELKTAAEAALKSATDSKLKLSRSQHSWLSLIHLFLCTETLWKRYRKKIEDLMWVRTQIRAAIILQKFYRRMGQTINPKKMVRQRAMDHLLLYFRSLAPETFEKARKVAFGAVKRDEESFKVQDALLSLHRKSNFHLVRLIQMMWRRYVLIKKQRIERLTLLWSQAMRLLVPHCANKKQQKKAKELEAKYQKIDQYAALVQHLRICQRQYYKAIAAYVKANRVFRQGVKAFIFAKLKRGEAVYLSGAPDFHYLLSVPEMQQFIESLAGADD